MESRSSESNYRSNSYSGSVYNSSSESNYSSESRDAYRVPSYSSESASKSKKSTVVTEKSSNNNVRKYNSLEEIDSLIEKLEESMQTVNFESDKVNQAMQLKRQKLEKLKALVGEARKAEKEQLILKLLESENNELDEAIKEVSKGFHI